MKIRVLGAVVLIVCALETVTDAYAGADNRNARSKLNYPINLDGFGAPLPAVAMSGSDLATFATAKSTSNKSRPCRNWDRCSTAPPAQDAIRSPRWAAAVSSSAR